jgi:hypothetical protein
MLKKIANFAYQIALGRAKSKLMWRFPLAYGAYWLYTKFRDKQHRQRFA